MPDAVPPTAPPPRPDQRLRRRQRLTRSSAFEAAYAQGHKWIGRCLVLWRSDTPDAALRLGVVASRKVGNAVARARAKRRLREAYRRLRPTLSGPHDVVLVARASILTAPWPEVTAELLLLARKAKLMPPCANCS